MSVFSRISVRGLTAAGLFNPTRAVFMGLFDVRGRLVRNLTPQLLSTGRGEAVLDSRSLPPGAYAVRFRCGSETKELKLTVVR